MTILHMSRSVSEVRAYDQPDGYALRLPYRAIVTVKHLGDDVVYLGAAVGTLNLGDFPALLAMLKAQGVTTVMFERHGRMKKRSI